MENSSRYDINFFKPHTPFLKETVRLVTTGLIVWFVAVYGFHVLLRIIETPTPEKNFITYQALYPKLQQGTASFEERKEMANIYLGLLGKSAALLNQKNQELKMAFTSVVISLFETDEKELLLETIAKLKADKSADIQFVVNTLGIENDLSRVAVLPYALVIPTSLPGQMTSPGIPATMEKYLVHNQSVLTDTKFLGFPFHYFYSAVFLLALFVTICLVYCKAIDRVMKKHDMESEFN
ncbi:MAG: DUF4212 domain-containing protein [Proteobacteria bacterium]|nr:DUF4212 domain-containing protein [Pseudomonadota bacterium]